MRALARKASVVQHQNFVCKANRRKYDYLGDLRTVDVHIRRLREKIERVPSQPEYIFTKWGVGYYFTDKD